MASGSKRLPYMGPSCVVGSLVRDSGMPHGAVHGHRNLQVKDVLQRCALELLIKGFINVYSLSC